jgi:hypothetical protein
MKKTPCLPLNAAQNTAGVKTVLNPIAIKNTL